MKLINDNQDRGILIVDDEKTFTYGLEQALRDKNYKNVFTSFKGTDALSQLVAHEDTIYVVILDLSLPDIDGLAVVKHLSNVHTMPVGIIILTGYASVKSSAEFFKSSHNNVIPVDYIEKPLNIKLLLSDIDETLALIHHKRETHLNSLVNISYTEFHDMNEQIAEIKKTLSSIGDIEPLKQRIENFLRKQHFITHLGFDFIRIIIIALVVFGLLYLNVDNFLVKIINQLKE
ncbi:MAG: response regulator [Candidatus Brocadiaceae bacterium]|nr:response regulator [Candidatus Brocadiaceae bacterium]